MFKLKFCAINCSIIFYPKAYININKGDMYVNYI